VLDAELTERVGGERFVQEIRLTARLQHPHVLALLDSGVFEAGALAQRPYYVMPYVAGESLRARLARGPLEVSDALRVLREVADALSYAHEQGVIHRDIKPENILLSRGHAVVADFGIAKALVASQSDELPNEAPSRGNGVRGALTQFSNLVGTPAYMAPEQAVKGALVDHRADVYAWGVVAYELLACRHPFERKTRGHEFIGAHAREVPRPLHEIAPAVPAGVAALVMRSLANRPAERPQTASEILAALDVSPTSRTSGAPKSTPRRLRTVIALAMLILADALGADAYPRDHAIVVTGTGNPAHDVRAIQAAVDHGGDIVLKGHISLAIPATKPVDPVLASGWYPALAEILISKAVNIAGERDAQGEMATIESGTIPFYVDAPGERVTIRGIQFIRPISEAILVHAARGLEITSSKVQGIVPFPGGGSGGITINTRGNMELISGAGTPENVSGHVVIASNEIDGAGGTAQAGTAGVMVLNVGQSPDRDVDVDIVSNQIRNTTAPAILIRRVQGTVRVLGNTIETSSETVRDVDAVRLGNAKSILMANNTVECKWPNAAGIQIFSPYAEWPTDSAIVEDNDVRMSPPSGAALGDFSAGISIRGFTHGAVVRHNTISGRARAALSMYAFRGGVPADNTFIDNRLAGFQSTVADIFVSSGVAKAHILGTGSLLDYGTGTIRGRRVANQ
jgi:hypothetical protein